MMGGLNQCPSNIEIHGKYHDDLIQSRILLFREKKQRKKIFIFQILN